MAGCSAGYWADDSVAQTAASWAGSTDSLLVECLVAQTADEKAMNWAAPKVGVSVGRLVDD